MSFLAVVLVAALGPRPSLAQQCSTGELLWDVRNCGTCGDDCTAGAVQSLWKCDQGTCVSLGCEAGFWDLDGDQQCEYACAFTAQEELCNGLDDDCDGLVDEDLAPLPAAEVCGVSPGAFASECTTGVAVACQAGTWQCTFPAGVCAGGCSEDDEVCDDLDNDCDGALNENVAGFGLACASDDGLPFPGHGRCKASGTLVCDGPDTVVCSAQKADCASLPFGCTELCDGVDNDCDGLVDEAFIDKGPDPQHFVGPDVVQVDAGTWMFAHEASRANATRFSPGSGNGYRCAGASCPPGVPPAPPGVPLGATQSCSVPDRKPWFHVTAAEAEQTCDALGGYLCGAADLERACEAETSCTWAYAPRGVECATSFTNLKYCNLAPSYDSDAGLAGDQDGLLETASPELSQCFADWMGLLGNTGEAAYDATGNLREIGKLGTNIYALLGGSFLTQAESGATCGFDSYVVDDSFLYLDTGFRCCFDVDPRQ